MRRLVLALVSLGFVGSHAACKKDEAAKQTAEPGVAKPAVDPCTKAHAEGPLAWFRDDYAAALACAQQNKLPLVVDLWAPWCHTCLSMKSTVFQDPSFAATASKFVFVALDTDREVNAAAVDKFPIAAWPTFYVIGPDEAVLARFVGAASVAQFHAFLETGTRALAGGAAGPDAHLLAAERAVAAEDFATAETELTAALAAAPADWPRKADALVSLISSKHKRKDLVGCVELAEKALDETGTAASATDFLYRAMACATELAKDSTDAAVLARVQKLRERAVARWQKLVDDPAAALSIDDRSDAMANLREALIVLGRKDEAKAVAEKQRALVDDAAAKAPTPMAAMTYLWPRAELYVFLERPLDLVPDVEKLAAALPKEYDPPARLGWLYFKAGKLDDAAKWTDRALLLAYGPRKVRVLTQRADIAKAQGDRSAERLFREEIVKTLERLPPGQATPAVITKAKQSLTDLDKPPAPAGSGSAPPPK
ncbi:MAG: thioredoxin family protein [Deltaproteobacteria bacterium]|nr:thioredoxin family protein [Deltaproteobacteria bacterium]